MQQGIYDLDGKLIDQVVIEKDMPQKVKIASINHIQPLKEGYLEHLADNLNQIANPSKIILPYLNIK